MASTSTGDVYEPIEPSYQGYGTTDGSGGLVGRKDSPPFDHGASTRLAPIPTREDAETVSKYLQVESHEIFVESPGTQSLPQIYDIAMVVYTVVKKWTYIILTTLFAILIAILWAITFAFFTFITVWIVNPSLRIFYIVINIWARAWAVAIHSSFDPCYLSAALFLSRIKVAITGAEKSKPAVRAVMDA